MQVLRIERLKAAEEAVRAYWPDARPRCAVVLGSGWRAAAEELQGEEIAGSEIPGWGAAGVEGHAGRLRRVFLDDGAEIFLFVGRRHFYEGEGWTPVVCPVWLARAFGAETVLLTNAAGGIRDDLRPGTLMAVSDHIHLQGSNPLIGPRRPEFGPRFPDQSRLYDPALRRALLDAGADTEGVYLAAAGPAFETPAEIRAFRALGADAVGMSTAPEATFAGALGLRVAAVSLITNRAAGLSAGRLSHEEVRAVAHAARPAMRSLLVRFLRSVSGGREEPTAR